MLKYSVEFTAKSGCLHPLTSGRHLSNTGGRVSNQGSGTLLSNCAKNGMSNIVSKDHS